MSDITQTFSSLAPNLFGLNTAGDVLTLEVNGVSYTGFKTASAYVHIEAASGAFEFTISALNSLNSFPIKQGSSCRILANGTPIVNGYVEKITIDYSASPDHTITIEGRDKTCDVIDSTLGQGLNFNSGVTIIDVANKVLNYLGITNIKVYSTAGDIEPFGKGEIVASQTGETAFEFIEKYAKKRSLLITTDGDGNLIFSRTSKQTINTILNSNPSVQPTILNARVNYDNTKRFYKYILNTQDNVSASTTYADLNTYNPTPNQIVNKQSTSFDEGCRQTRILNLMQSEQSYVNTKDLQNRATWEANIRRARSFQYDVEVQGFNPVSDPDIIWKPNLLVTVIDNFCDISTKLLTQNVTYNYRIDGGSTCKITFVDAASYSVDVIQGVQYKNRVKKGTTEGKDLFVNL